MKKILFPLPTNTENINYASGSLISIYNSLKKHFDIIPVGPLKTSKPLIRIGLNLLYHKNLLPKQFSISHTWKQVDNYSLQLQSFIDINQFDAVFSASTLFAAKIKTDKPVFAYTDFSYYNALNYYPSASNIWNSSWQQALEVDKFCFEHYTKVFLASDWAKIETTKAYKLNQDHIISIGRGANLESGYNLLQVEKIINNRSCQDSKKFLFVGVGWKRKGGDIAFNIVSRLRDAGYNIILQVVGCIPPKNISKQSFVETFPFLSRSKPDELKVLLSLFSNAWCFILPTQAEAMGIVYAEAASFGLPSIATKTGGVEAAIENNKTGILFNPTDNIEDMSKRIINLLENKAKYMEYSHNSFLKYKNELNWDAIASKIKDYVTPFL